MNVRSVRFRLMFWYVLAFSIATAVIFSVFFLITQRALYSNTDSALTLHTKTIVTLISSKGMGIHPMITQQSFAQEYGEVPGMIALIMSPSGQIINSSMSVSPSDTGFIALYNLAKSATGPFFANQTIARSQLRFLVTPLWQGTTLQDYILVAHPIDVIESALHSLLLTLIFVYIGLLVPTFLAGYVVARSGLKPITDISEKLKHISSENLRERIPVPRTDDEVAELAHTFNGLLDRLHGAFDRERQFIGDLAHELKTPLATQRSGIEVTLAKPRGAADYKKALEEALVDSNRISSTLKNILDLAWSQADSAMHDAKPVDLSRVAEDIVDTATKLAHGKHITVIGKIVTNVRVTGKADKLSRAFLNIVDNAVKFTPIGGSIAITLETKKGNVLFNVKDSGAGITQEDLPHIFERFYRGSKTDRTFGSGLGLAIAKGTIVVHQGSIAVRSRPGHGTLVSVTLPLTGTI